jgi:hypothetical protein
LRLPRTWLRSGAGFAILMAFLGAAVLSEDS